jgi:CRP-like cAMP-binding protein
MPSLLRTSLMKDVRQQFVDQFLSACTVEVFSPGEELLQRGMNSPDLYLLVSGNVDVLSVNNVTVDQKDDVESKVFGGTSVGESEYMSSGLRVTRRLDPGEFINEISFFTESHQVNTIKTVNVVQVLTISREAYKSICADHPCSAGIVLQNLLNKVQELLGLEPEKNILLSKPLAAMKAGSSFHANDIGDFDDADCDDIDDDDDEGAERAIMKINNKAAMASLQELVKVHIEKLRDDLTTRFLFAASRGDIATISLMCDQGFDPNSMDYDNRTALMVASMKGQTDVVRKLIEEYKANVNLVDVNGGSALYEAAKHGHDDTMEVLIRNDAALCMSESLAASTLCQLVFDGDATTLRRLLRAKINVNAADYDRRTAAHIAAAEGNLVAFKILVEFGCNLYAEDRWNNMIEDEAKKALNGSKLLEFLKEIQSQAPATH